MNLAAQHPMRARGRRCFAGAGYTIMELMLAASISLLVLGAAYSFLFFCTASAGGSIQPDCSEPKGGQRAGVHTKAGALCDLPVGGQFGKYFDARFR